MKEQKLEILFQRYLNKTATDAEKQAFFELIRQPGAGKMLRTLSERYAVPDDFLMALSEAASHRILTAVFAAGNPPAAMLVRHLHFFRQRRVWVAAAALLLIVTGSVYLLLQRTDKKAVAVVGNQVFKDVSPGHCGALLILSGGRSIVLDTAKNGKLAEGFIKSSGAVTVQSTHLEYATLFTPLGRQQQITLSDGTKVWLNAGSSFRFPTVFTGGRRSVEINGEAYFEVAHNTALPFMVKAGNEEIKVVGTHFNVNAYADEQTVRTTLLEGSVQINNRIMLRPGEQYGNGLISKVNTDLSVAWVFGYFQFDHATIKEVMRQLARWYDVEVSYEGKITSEVFGGEMQRTLKLSEVLDLLSGTGIHYTLNGKTLIIRP